MNALGRVVGIAARAGGTTEAAVAAANDTIPHTIVILSFISGDVPIHRACNLLFLVFLINESDLDRRAAFQSLTFGRPPSFSNAFIDCHMAEPEPAPPDNGKEVEMSCQFSLVPMLRRCVNLIFR